VAVRCARAQDIKIRQMWDSELSQTVQFAKLNKLTVVDLNTYLSNLRFVSKSHTRKTETAIASILLWQCFNATATSV
jgi:hypothetical protein